MCRLRLSSTKTCEISPYFLPFLFCIRIALKKFTQVISYVFCTQVRRHVHKQTKRRYAKEKQHVLFSENQFCSVWVWNLLCLTPWCFSLKFLLDVPNCVYWVWLGFEPQIRPTRLAIICLLITARVEGKVCLCVKLFHFFLGWIRIWPEICCVMYQIQWKFLRGFSGKNYSWRIFQKFSADKGPLLKLVKFHPTFCNFYTRSVSRWKNSHKYFHMLFAPK